MYQRATRSILNLIWVALFTTAVAAQEDHQNIEELFSRPMPPQFTEVRDFGLLIRELAEFYEARGFEPAWIEGDRLGSQARELLDTLDRADTHGLRVKDYRWRILSPENLPADLSIVDGAIRARLDVALSATAMRYIKDLHQGRFSPAQLGLDLDTSYRRINLDEELTRLVSADSIAAALGRYAPQIPVIDGTTSYDRLRAALARYRAMAAESNWQTLPDDTVIHPGEGYAALALLQRRLELAGDMSAGTPVPDVYEGAIVEAVREFQRRHGLDVDGVLGAKSFEALNVPWSDRAAQIVIAMERLRWVPDHELGRVILVNVPHYHLYAFQRDGEAVDVQFESDVIVGKTYARYQTPIFSGTLAYLDFRPYWNVPWSIVRRELRQHFGEPGYLESKDMEIVAAFGLNAEPLAATEENLAKAARGEYRVRQRPGPNNSLGLVKFIFPNQHAVFLHSTPVQVLFGKSERAFSHGCVRVADPVGLAEWVLETKSGWERDRIESSMGSGPPTRVQLQEGIPVYIVYSTAFVDRESRGISFRPDIYGLDASLAEKLGESMSVLDRLDAEYRDN